MWFPPVIFWSMFFFSWETSLSFSITGQLCGNTLLQSKFSHDHSNTCHIGLNDTLKELLGRFMTWGLHLRVRACMRARACDNYIHVSVFPLSFAGSLIIWEWLYFSWSDLRPQFLFFSFSIFNLFFHVSLYLPHTTMHLTLCARVCVCVWNTAQSQKSLDPGL